MASAQQWQERAVAETGGTQQNARFEFAPAYGTTGGTLTISFNDFESAPLAYPFSAAELKAALEALASVGADGVIVSGAMGGPYEIEFVGGNAGQVVPAPLVNGSLLEPPQDVEVEEIQQGSTTKYGALAAQYWDDHADKASAKLRFLHVKLALLDYRIGEVGDAVDVRTGQMNVVEVKESQRVAALERRRAAVEAAIKQELLLIAGAGRRTFGGTMRHKTPNGLPYGVLRLNRTTGNLE